MYRGFLCEGVAHFWRHTLVSSSRYGFTTSDSTTMSST